MLSASDIRGLDAMIPTPCLEGADGWDVENSVDLAESERMTKNLIRDGVSSISLCGTTGEGAALLWEEKRNFVDTVVKAAARRVPVFAGCTALGTKEVIRQMRAMKDIGADGAFIGLPLWQTPTIENSVQFFSELGEALPDMPIKIYANRRFFKSNFPTEFWAGVAQQAPTVIACKISYGMDHLTGDLEVAGHRINFIPGAGAAGYYAYKKAGRKMTAMWATGASMGPEPLVALMDAILAEDEKRIDEIEADLRSIPPSIPEGERPGFDNYNTEAEKRRSQAAGYAKVGPPRTPYRTMPEHWKRQADEHGKAWAELRKKYMKVPMP